jgi:hypothetical protein
LAQNEQNGSPNYDTSDNALKQRCLAVWKLCKKVPNLKKVKMEDVKLVSNFHDKTLPDVMRLVGISEADAGKAGKLYRKIDRYIKSLLNSDAGSSPPTTSLHDHQHEIPFEIDLSVQAGADESLAHVSMESSAISTLTTAMSKAATTSKSSSSLVLARKPKASSRSDFIKLTTLSET